MKQGKPADASTLLGWADATREKIGDVRPFIEQTDVDRIISTCIAQMGKDAFTNTYENGRKMKLDEAVTYSMGKS